MKSFYLFILACLTLIGLGSTAHAQSYDIYCDGYGYCRASPTQYNHNLVGLAFTKDDEPWFFTSSYSSTSPNFSSYQAEADTMSACNKSANRAPCRLHSWVANNQCIAVVQSSSHWHVANDKSCGRAKKEAMAHCKANATDPSTCKQYKSKSTSSWW